MKKTDSTRLLFDLNIFSKRKADLLKMFDNWLKEDSGLHIVYTPNAEQIVQSRGDKKFLEVLQQADLLLPDGVGLVMAARFLSIFNKANPIAQRITGVSVVVELLEVVKKLDLDVLVIGGRNYSPSDYFAYQGVKVNWTPGYEQAFSPTTQEEKQLEEMIKQIKPRLVFVALGAPTQELWIAQHRNLLRKNNVEIVMAVGGSFDYLLNKVPRAPRWMQKLGLEWLFRLIIEPWRIKRQLRLIEFIALTIKKAID